MRSLAIERFNNQPSVFKLTVSRDGTAEACVTGSFNAKPKCHDAAHKLGVDVACVTDLVSKFHLAGCPKGETLAIDPDLGSRAADPLVFTLRGVTQPQHAGLAFANLREVIQTPATVDDLIVWRDATKCCAVDVDWHADTPRVEDCVFSTFVRQLIPAPFAAWRTRTGGLRLMYLCERADLLAAVAAVRTAERFCDTGITGIELKTDTRHPGTAMVWYCDPDLDIAAIWPRSSADDVAVDAEEWADWLTDRGMALGRYSHEFCVMAPYHTSQSPSPVEVRPGGIMCHSCEGRTSRGWLSASVLMRGEDNFRRVTPLSHVVSNITHYEHAEYILREHAPHIVPDKILKLYYEAMLYSWHGFSDSRVADAFRSRDLIRFQGFWATLGGEKRDAGKTKITIANLPSCRTVTGEVNGERVEAFSDTIDLAKYGYPAIKPVFGHRIGTYHPDYDSEDRTPRIVVPHRTMKFQPQFLGEKQRMNRDRAWGILRDVYPGVDVDLIEMLIYCRGLVERGSSSLHPKFLFDGVSGSGKSSHPYLAAAICGDRCTDITAATDSELLGQKVHEAMRVGSFANIGEVAKEAKKARVDMRTFLTFILNLTPESSVHALYIGQVRFGWLPIFCLSDTDYPEDVLGDEQLGRRLLYRHLGTERLKWETSTRRAGLVHWADPRSADGDVRIACDSIMSHVIDTYFRGNTPDLIDVAASRGFKFLNADGVSDRRKLQLRDLYFAWASYKTPATYTVEPGWKAFGTSEESDLARLWSRVHDEGNPCSWQRMNERSWSDATGHPRPLRGKVESYRRGSAGVVCVKFEEQVDGKWLSMTGGA